MSRPPPAATLFPYTTLFRSSTLPAVVSRSRSISRYCCAAASNDVRSEEHTSELQSRLHLVCRLLLEKQNDHRQPQRDARDPARGVRIGHHLDRLHRISRATEGTRQRIGDSRSTAAQVEFLL